MLVRRGYDLPFHYGIIICALRRFEGDTAPYYANLLRVMEHADEDDVFAAASLELARSVSR